MLTDPLCAIAGTVCCSSPLDIVSFIKELTSELLDLFQLGNDLYNLDVLDKTFPNIICVHIDEFRANCKLILK